MPVPNKPAPTSEEVLAKTELIRDTLLPSFGMLAEPDVTIALKLVHEQILKALYGETLMTQAEQLARIDTMIAQYRKGKL